MLEKFGLRKPIILLPDESADLSRWAVVACDQFTSQPDYWQRVEDYVGDAPSTLNITYPEAWLSQGDARIERINAAMLRYEKDVLTRRFEGFALVERTIATGKRLGLIAAVDLEKYDFSVGSSSLIRATEGTILERIPPRVRIRKNASLELPHILLLADDPEKTLIEPIYEKRSSLEKLYDFDLMEKGGHIRGWKVDDCNGLEAALSRLYEVSNGLLFAVGDGNHSLATARQCWLDLKDTLTEEERENHPARFALVEIENLHDDALVFEPIHRALFHADAAALCADFSKWLAGRGMALSACEAEEAMFTLVKNGGDQPLFIENIIHPLPLFILQKFLDEWLKANPSAAIDYIHGEDAVRALCKEDGTLGILLPAMDKHILFESVIKGGALPRKTFSMGEAVEKRYYLECRSIRP